MRPISRYKALAALVLLLALARCAPFANAPGAAPYSHDDNAGTRDHGGGEGGGGEGGGDGMM